MYQSLMHVLKSPVVLKVVGGLLVIVGIGAAVKYLYSNRYVIILVM